MKPLEYALLWLALLCFVLHIYFDGWHPTPGAARPNFMALGLAFATFAVLSTSF